MPIQKFWIAAFTDAMNDFIQFYLVIFLLGPFILIGIFFAIHRIGFFYEYGFPHFNYQLDFKKKLWKEVLS